MLERAKNTITYLAIKWLEFMMPNILILTSTFTKICKNGARICF